MGRTTPYSRRNAVIGSEAGDDGDVDCLLGLPDDFEVPLRAEGALGPRREPLIQLLALDEDLLFEQ